MLPEVKQDILSVLEQILAILRTKEEKDVLEIRELSNHVIHNATLFEDEDSLSVAVLIYAFSKVIENLGGKVEYGEFIIPLERAIKELKVNEFQGFRALIRTFFRLISAKDSQVDRYVSDVLQHARIKKGCKVCEHGVSCAKSAQLLNISQWELMQYLGKTTQSDQWAPGHDVRNRLRFARGLFP